MGRLTWPLRRRKALRACSALVTVGMVGGAVLCTTEVAHPDPAHVSPTQPNIVLILTDDQDAGTLEYMPNVVSMLVEKGTRFPHAFDNNPLCCPSRSTIMTGQTSGHNGVWYNSGPGGGFRAFKPHADQTIFRWLHEAGYHTGFIGKFLNGYKYQGGDYRWVLPGVDEWDAFLLEGSDESETGCDPSGYFATCYSHNGTLEKHGPSEYSATTSGAKAVDFIARAPESQPFFLYYAPRAPHLPTTPETPYAHACNFVPPRRLPSFDQNIVNGPEYMQRPPLSRRMISWLDAMWIADCQTLLSVDDEIGKIVQALDGAGRLENTLILFTSDNGFMFGEHRWKGKMVPYEESDRIPLAIRWDALRSRGGVRDWHLVTNVDFTATFLDAAGVDPPKGYVLDGQSMLPLLGGGGTWQTVDGLLIEHSGGDGVPPYCGLRTLDWLYTHYATGEEELYDIRADPYELVNVVADNASEANRLRLETQALCVPLPPGFSWVAPRAERVP